MAAELAQIESLEMSAFVKYAVAAVEVCKRGSGIYAKCWELVLAVCAGGWHWQNAKQMGAHI